MSQKSSLQKWVGSVRPPRVHIQYEVETRGSIKKVELPFLVGVLADLSGKQETPPIPLKERKFVEINLENFDKVMKKIAPTVELAMAGGNTDIVFEQMEDFNPESLIERIDSTRLLYNSRNNLRDLRSRMDGKDVLENAFIRVLESADLQTQVNTAFGLAPDAEEPSLETEGFGNGTPIQEIIENGKMVIGTEKKSRGAALKLIREFAKQFFASPTDETDPSPVMKINEKINDLDKEIADILNPILQNENFKNLESRWRGLHHFVMNTDPMNDLEIRVLDAPRSVLAADQNKAKDKDQSGLFKLIYEQEYGTFGGTPYSLLVGDYYFSPKDEDVKLLEDISGIAAAAHAPFIASADCSMFHIESYLDLPQRRDLSEIFSDLEWTRWKDFRKTEDSRYVVLTLPRVLLRKPYGAGNEVENLDFEEDMDTNSHSNFLWGNASYYLAERITQAFSTYGWTAAIRGYEGGGLVESLPLYIFETESGNKALKCPTEIAITDRREKELSDLGFLPLCHRKGTGQAVFFGGQTTNKPDIYYLDAATDNSRLSSLLPYLLAASRFAHYVKAMMRDKVGAFTTHSNVAKFLNTWISNYVLLDDDAPEETKARYPLREARVDVTDVPGRPGVYNAVIYLRPHFQLEELKSTIHLVTELPPPAG